ncbi:phosphate transport system permease protein [Natronocella acetinitrilica]|uniref:Phosphate transport system permease protein n=1 Tax=Natronocella acetinitrilica TaxID=414046 RepID=A0AAE3G6B6_9GAMM|nr:ABC transporter permease subunit [Natronocella acetinitrilica]MCP1676675.1 phosphate transport system permease protein [Natronocella acetinitrilica]
MTDVSNASAVGREKQRIQDLLPSGEKRARLRRWRSAKDYSAKYLIATFGFSVIIALGLIFVYLFSEVLPMLKPASVGETVEYDSPGGNPAQTVQVASDRHRELGVRFTDDRRAVFFRPLTGEVTREYNLPFPEGVAITARGRAEPRTRLVAYGLENGQALVTRHTFSETFSDGRRDVTGNIEYPLGDEDTALLDVVEDGTPITQIAVQEGSRGISVVAALADGRLRFVQFETTTSFMTGETTVERQVYDLERPPGDSEITAILLDITMQNLLVGDDDGRVHYYNVRRPSQARIVDSRRVTPDADAAVTSMEYLLGTVSLIVGGSDGSVGQWFLVRDADNVQRITFVRGFEGHDAPVTVIAPEYARKGFATADETGRVKVHYSTSHRTVLDTQVTNGPIRTLSFAPRANALYTVDDEERFRVVAVNNPHPEVSMAALWDRVWYEGRSSEEFVWQSSSATDEFEPKFSLVPLTVGTLKAAFYAMLFATPLAILGAIYSAYFMAPRMRGMVKPTIEIMEALPTVILGFLAGLWLAPFVENHIPAVFSIVILMPVLMVAFAYLWTRMIPEGLRLRVPPGWEAALLIPVVLAIGWFCVTMSPLIEIWFFNGDLRQWLTDVGITYDQRNALVVGVAMGFAVIPTIYSISEDAVFNVPKHLTQGSLALGATPWQTVTKVVLLTASPGIFSAVMIGFGRAVGETMIVLMATGNSPVVNFNIFEGMRTLSANIAVEMPEAAVGGTHFRILFLAALVLFVLTFIMNTAAELVRQRLRRKYSSL